MLLEIHAFYCRMSETVASCGPLAFLLSQSRPHATPCGTPSGSHMDVQCAPQLHEVSSVHIFNHRTFFGIVCVFTCACRGLFCQWIIHSVQQMFVEFEIQPGIISCNLPHERSSLITRKHVCSQKTHAHTLRC